MTKKEILAALAGIKKEQAALNVCKDALDTFEANFPNNTLARGSRESLREQQDSIDAQMQVLKYRAGCIITHCIKCDEAITTPRLCRCGLDKHVPPDICRDCRTKNMTADMAAEIRKDIDAKIYALLLNKS